MSDTEVKVKLAVTGAGAAAANGLAVAEAIDRIGTSIVGAISKAGGLQAALGQLGGVAGGVSGASGKASDAIKGIGGAAEVSAKQTAAAFRQLPMQLQDVAVSLAGGMNPLMVMLQQGPQITSSFGGVGATIRAVAAAITPFTAAVGLGTVAVGGFAAAAWAGARESKQLADNFALSGNMASRSAGQINDQTVALARAASVGRGEVRDLLTALAASGEQTAQTFDASARAAVALSKVNGKTAAESVAAFDGMGESASAWALKANKSYHFLSAAQYDLIKSLEVQGRNSEAARVGLDALASTMESRTTPALGWMGRAAATTGKAFSDMWDAAKGVGRPETIEDRIAAARDAIKTAQSGFSGPYSLPKMQAELDALIRQKAVDDLRRANRAGDQKAEEETIARRQALAALTDKLTGVNTAFGKGLRALHETYQAGEMSLQTYQARVAKLIETEGGGKEMAEKARAVAEANISLALASRKNGAEAELRIQDDLQAALEYRREVGLADERTYARELAAIAAKRLDVERRALEEQRALEATKPTDPSNPAAAIQKQVALKQLDGQIAALQDKARQNPVLLQYKLGGIDEAEAAKVRAGIARVAQSTFDAEAAKNDALRGTAAGLYEQVRSLEMGSSAWETYQTKSLRAEAGLLQFDAATQGGNFALEERARLLLNIADLTDRKTLAQALSPDAVRSFGSEFESAFGRAGGALTGLMSQLDQYAAKTREIARLKDLAAGDPDKARQVAAMEAQAQISAYASMAGAGKGFFKEHTAGYKVLAATEKAFAVLQLAMTAKTTAEKLGLIATGTTAKVAATVTEATAVTAGQAEETAAVAAGEAARNVAKTPGVFMAFMSALGPWGMAAAGVAIAAVLGGAFKGGTSGVSVQSAEDRQKANGTGTVFGDATAKSESVANSIKLLSESAKLGNTYQAGMLAALRNIEAAMSGVANLVIRAGGITTGDNFGVKTGVLGTTQSDPLHGWHASLLGLGGLWGKTQAEITDSGLNINGRVSDLMAGSGVRQYADVKTTTSSWFGFKSSSDTKTLFQAVGDGLASQFGLIFKGVGDSLASAAGALGLKGEDVRAAVNAFNVDISRLSLKGLSGQVLQDAIGNAIGAEADTIAKAVIPGLDAFQQIGEGYYQTVIRVAAGTEQASSVLATLGIKAVNFADITNKQGDVASGIVKDSIVAAESIAVVTTHVKTSLFGLADSVVTTTEYQMSSIGKLISTFDGSAEEIGAVYKQLVGVRFQFTEVGMSGELLNATMITAAGGLDALSGSLTTYFNEFFSADERHVAGLATLTTQMNALGINVIPTTREEFRALVESIDTSTESGQALKARLIGLSGAFADVVPATETAAAATTEYASTQVQAAQTVSNAWSGVWDSLYAEARRLRGFDSPAAQAALMSDFAVTTAQARAGDIEAARKLPNLSKQIEEAAQKTTSSRAELEMVQARLAASLERTAAATGAPQDGYLKVAERVDAMHDDLVATQVQVAGYLNRMARIWDKFDVDGMPATRTGA